MRGSNTLDGAVNERAIVGHSSFAQRGEIMELRWYAWNTVGCPERVWAEQLLSERERDFGLSSYRARGSERAPMKRTATTLLAKSHHHITFVARKRNVTLFGRNCMKVCVCDSTCMYMSACVSMCA